MDKRHVFTADSGLVLRRKFDNAPSGGTPDGAGPTEAPIATLEGYALKWNVLSSDRGGYKVKLLPGSANFATPTLALWHHDFAAPIGNTANGTLRLYPDSEGIRIECDLPDTTTGRDVE